MKFARKKNITKLLCILMVMVFLTGCSEKGVKKEYNLSCVSGGMDRVLKVYTLKKEANLISVRFYNFVTDRQSTLCGTAYLHDAWDKNMKSIKFTCRGNYYEARGVLDGNKLKIQYLANSKKIDTYKK